MLCLLAVRKAVVVAAVGGRARCLSLGRRLYALVPALAVVNARRRAFSTVSVVETVAVVSGVVPVSTEGRQQRCYRPSTRASRRHLPTILSHSRHSPGASHDIVDVRAEVSSLGSIEASPEAELVGGNEAVPLCLARASALKLACTFV